MAKKFKTWDQYVKEAERPPFVLPIDAQHKITIKAPTGGAVLEVASMMNEGQTPNPEEMLRLVAGDAADELMPLIREAPANVMNNLLADIMNHFGYASMAPNEDGTPGDNSEGEA